MVAAGIEPGPPHDTSAAALVAATAALVAAGGSEMADVKQAAREAQSRTVGRAEAAGRRVMFDPPMDNAPPEASANIEELASELRARIRQDKAFVHDADQLAAFSLMLGALDATRDRLAEVERRLDSVSTTAGAAAELCMTQDIDLAAREAEVLELRAALRTAMEYVRLWHGMGMDTASEQRAWKLYEDGAPEWKPLREALSRPAGSTEALRAMLERAANAGAREGALYTLEMWGDRALHHNDNDMKAESAANNCGCAAIVARLLPPTGDEATKGAEE